MSTIAHRSQPALPSPAARCRRQVVPTCHPPPPDRTRAGLESEPGRVRVCPAHAFPGVARTPRLSPGLFWPPPPLGWVSRNSSRRLCSYVELAETLASSPLSLAVVASPSS
jgi:hypothetical protein